MQGELNSDGQPLPQPRRLLTPARSDLLALFHAGEKQAALWIGLEILLILGGLLGWSMQADKLPAWLSMVLFSAGFLGMFDFVAAQMMTSRLRLEDVREQARLGRHSRDSLIAAVERVKRRLGLGEQKVQVYLAREKEVNAYALRFEFLPGWRLFNSVQLNRAIVHLLDEDELESVIGHELGHVFPYAPLAGRCMLVHAVFAGVLSLLIAHLLRHYEVSLGAPLLALWPARWLAFSSWTSQIRLIEFLCDDFGARASGVLPAMTSEIKIGLEQQARSGLLMHVLEAKARHEHVPVSDLMQAYEESLPFGRVESESARQQLESQIGRLAREDSESSLKGFYKYLFKSHDTDHEALEEQLKQMHAIRRLARVPVDLPAVAADVRLLASCIQAIEDHPDHVLLHLPEEVDDRASTHPNTSRRLLYLWRNRDEISQG